MEGGIRKGGVQIGVGINVGGVGGVLRDNACGQ